MEVETSGGQLCGMGGGDSHERDWVVMGHH